MICAPGPRRGLVGSAVVEKGQVNTLSARRRYSVPVILTTDEGRDMCRGTQILGMLLGFRRAIFADDSFSIDAT
jgi:hypothetical protein